jgi:hypothetical protein
MMRDSWCENCGVIIVPNNRARPKKPSLSCKRSELAFRKYEQKEKCEVELGGGLQWRWAAVGLG